MTHADTFSLQTFIITESESESLSALEAAPLNLQAVRKPSEGSTPVSLLIEDEALRKEVDCDSDGVLPLNFGHADDRSIELSQPAL